LLGCCFLVLIALGRLHSIQDQVPLNKVKGSINSSYHDDDHDNDVDDDNDDADYSQNNIMIVDVVDNNVAINNDSYLNIFYNHFVNQNDTREKRLRMLVVCMQMTRIRLLLL
jgi:hypothetical protein